MWPTIKLHNKIPTKLSGHFIKANSMPHYESSLKIVIGNYENKTIQDLNILSDELNFYFDNITINRQGQNLLEVKTNSSNPQDNINLLEKITEFATLDSKTKIESNRLELISSYESEAIDLQFKLDSLYKLLSLAPSFEEIDPIESHALFIYLSNINKNIDEIKYRLSEHNQSEIKIQSNLTKQYGDIDTRQIRNLNKSYKEVILASFLGFFLSIFVILFRFIFTNQN